MTKATYIHPNLGLFLYILNYLIRYFERTFLYCIIYVCVLFLCSSVWGCTCVWAAAVDGRDQPWESSGAAHLMFCIGSLGPGLANTSCLHLLALWLQTKAALLFPWVLGFNLGSSFLHSKQFISPSCFKGIWLVLWENVNLPFRVLQGVSQVPVALQLL